jgi:hypothetical protein
MWPFDALREARRARIADRFPVDDRAWSKLAANRPCLSGLAPEDAASLKRMAAAFLSEKRFLEAVPDDEGSFSLNPGDMIPYPTRLAIAAFACLPALRLGLDTLRSFETVIVAPDEYALRREETDSAGVVSEYLEDVAGDALDYGPLTLSARDVAASGRGQGYNVVVHEVAHKLDMGNGEMDGAPRFPTGYDARRWTRDFREAFDDAVARAQRDERGAAKRGRRRVRECSMIDPYAASSPDEFFAVSLEYYFDAPDELRAAYPRVFDRLAEWLAGAS